MANKKCKELSSIVNSCDNENLTIPIKENPSLWFLFRTFFIIGATSFGGFMALVAVVQNQLVDRKRIISNTTIMDGISLASILPGPTSMNVITYIGYALRGIKGAFVSLFAVIVPSFAIMLAISIVYFKYGYQFNLNNVFFGIHPAIVAIIVAVAINLSKKSVSDSIQIFIIVISLVLFIFYSSVFTLFFVFIGSAFLGYIFYYRNINYKLSDTKRLIKNNFVKSIKIKKTFLFIVAILLLFILFLLFCPINNNAINISRKIFITFSSMSLSLFGGAYVFIPAMQDIVVNQLHWLTSREFSEGIALGQSTPGPVMITATFIGYKIYGIYGAIIATIGIFAPPGVLMVFMSKFYNIIRKSNLIIALFKGIRPAIVGLVFAAAFIISKEVDINIVTILIFLIVLLSILLYKINSMVLIFLSALIGFLIKYFAIF